MTTPANTVSDSFPFQDPARPLVARGSFEVTGEPVVVETFRTSG